LRSTDLFKKDRLGIALVGLGYYSTDLLAPALQQTKHCYLAGIVTGTPSKAETWKANITYLTRIFITTRLLTRSLTTMILMLYM
jgi:predicted dehydrogenase